MTVRLKESTRFGRLVTVCEISPDSYGKRRWACKCECGKLVFATSSALSLGKIKSCGCLKFDSPEFQTHGMSRQPTYVSWRNMWTRCTNPAYKQYADYGGAGVTVCERWKSFENFLADMGSRPEEMSLDRINPFGNYEPSNCRWATRLEQSRNTRGRVAIELLLKLNKEKSK